MRYRVMVIGEDHTEFCYKDEISDEELPGVIKEAEEDYPCGTVYEESY